MADLYATCCLFIGVMDLRDGFVQHMILSMQYIVFQEACSISNSTNLTCIILFIPISNFLGTIHQTKSLRREQSSTSNDPRVQIAVLEDTALFNYQQVLPTYPEDNSYPSSTQEFGTDRFRFVRLSRIEGISATRILDIIGCYQGWVRIEELSDSSWELVVHASSCRTLSINLSRAFLASEVNPNYDPLEPSTESVQNWGFLMARNVCRHVFATRVQVMIENGCLWAGFYHNYLASKS